MSHDWLGPSGIHMPARISRPQPQPLGWWKTLALIHILGVDMSKSGGMRLGVLSMHAVTKELRPNVGEREWWKLLKVAVGGKIPATAFGFELVQGNLICVLSLELLEGNGEHNLPLLGSPVSRIQEWRVISPTGSSPRKPALGNPDTYVSEPWALSWA